MDSTLKTAAGRLGSFFPAMVENRRRDAVLADPRYDIRGECLALSAFRGVGTPSNLASSLGFGSAARLGESRAPTGSFGPCESLLLLGRRALQALGFVAAAAFLFLLALLGSLFLAVARLLLLAAALFLRPVFLFDATAFVRERRLACGAVSTSPLFG